MNDEVKSEKVVQKREEAVNDLFNVFENIGNTILSAVKTGRAISKLSNTLDELDDLTTQPKEKDIKAEPELLEDKTESKKKGGKKNAKRSS